MKAGEIVKVDQKWLRVQPVHKVIRTGKFKSKFYDMLQKEKRK